MGEVCDAISEAYTTPSPHEGLLCTTGFVVGQLRHHFDRQPSHERDTPAPLEIEFDETVDVCSSSRQEVSTTKGTCCLLQNSVPTEHTDPFSGYCSLLPPHPDPCSTDFSLLSFSASSLLHGT